ncbi:unnamed protein product [Diabrotica balteata]|uniref:Trehalose-phosphatase n=1 Tax=Diabrotica balteata TaxID=107213 RepID=A0A9N9T135_DIABA|nr:unnamed protein product [Diabrotica balteata]
MFGDIINKVSSWVVSFKNEEDTSTIPAEDARSVDSHLFENNECTGVSNLEQTKNTESTSSTSKESSTSIQNSHSESDSFIKQNEHHSVDTLVFSPEVFSNAISSAVAIVKDTVSKLKESIEYKNILSEFNKEQDQFIQNQQDDLALSLPPWVGCPNEHILKENCLSLSSDLRHFLRLEVIYPDGSKYDHQLPSNFEDQVKELIAKLQEKLRAPAHLREEMEKEATKIIEAANFKSSKAHMAVEARPKVDWNKGSVALLLLEKKYGKDWNKETKVIFVGDDTTDEDAMRALKGNAALFRIANCTAETYADKIISSTEDTLKVLKIVQKHFKK